jgi:hypothetical protein
MREGIAANLSTISGLRTSWYVPDDPKPPIAVVLPDNVRYDVAFRRGLDQYTFFVFVIVGRVNERTAQSLIDSYCDPSGSSSIKAAIESDRTLGGAAYDCRVEELRNYTAQTIAEVTYLTAEWVVSVFAQ